MLSIILTIGKFEKAREEALSYMLSAIANQSIQDYELIIVEQCDEKMNYVAMIDDVVAKIPCSYIAVRGDRYSTTWGYNIGAKNSSGDILVFMCADLIFGNDYFKQIIDKFPGDYSFGWNKIIKLNDIGSQCYKQYQQYTAIWPNEYIELEQLPHPLGGAGASIIYDREFFFKKFGGFNETYTDNLAWDNDAGMRTAYAAGHINPLRWNTIDYCVLHLFHGGRSAGKSNREMLDITEYNPQLITDEIIKTGCGIIGGRKPLDLTRLKGVLNEGSSFRW